jgi:KUP system potassium uptake protein
MTRNPQLRDKVTVAGGQVSAPGVTRTQVGTLALAALGIVYGDIGTSPLYAFRECLRGPHGIAPTAEGILGILSLIVWSLTAVVAVKYLGVVMRADNRGEGGILALMALIRMPRVRAAARRPVLVILGLFGAALLYGDGMITPAISVLSAVEGLSVATSLLDPWVIPITLAVLAALFFVQHRGTARIGALFGPLMLVWMLTLAFLGVAAIGRAPEVLLALNPLLALQFCVAHWGRGLAVLGAVFLVVTGGEALYADMGHFGKRPIRLAWFSLVFPSLVLNYLGQGAVVLARPAAAANPFFNLAPRWALYPLVVLASLATVVASQAVISGAFSLTRQAVQLGYMPRLRIRHTSASEVGQIYVPLVNWALLAAAVLLVLGFRTSGAMAAAYGLAVSATMVVTSVLLFFVMRTRWRWGQARATLVTCAFLVVDVAFLGANSLKIREGGWFPLLVGVAGYVVMSTWRRGRELLRLRLQESAIPIDELLESMSAKPPARVSGTAVFLTGNPDGAPPTLVQNVRHNKVLHERIVFLTMMTDESPHVSDEERVEVLKLGAPFYRVVAHYGFMEEPNVPALLRLCGCHGLPIDPELVTYFLGRETLLATDRPGMPIWREKLFALISRNAVGPAVAFQIPVAQVVELGAQIEL